MVIGIAAVLVVLLAGTFGGAFLWDLMGRSEDDPGSMVDAFNYTYTIHDPDPSQDGTALLVGVEASRTGQDEIEWTNTASWTATNALVVRNIRMHNLTPTAVKEGSLARRYETICEDDNVNWTCPKAPASPGGGFRTTGRLSRGSEIWYTAAFGADTADLGIQVQTEHSLNIEWTQEARTSIHYVAPPGEVNGSINTHGGRAQLRRRDPRRRL